MQRYFNFLNIFSWSCSSCFNNLQEQTYSRINTEKDYDNIDDITRIQKVDADYDKEYYKLFNIPRNEINAFVVGSKMIEIENDFIK